MEYARQIGFVFIHSAHMLSAFPILSTGLGPSYAVVNKIGTVFAHKMF